MKTISAASWDEDFDSHPVIELLNSVATCGHDGNPTFEGFTHKECCALLYDMLDFSQPIPETEGRRILLNSIQEVSKAFPITQKSLLSKVNEYLHQYVSLPLQKYVLATSLSIRYSDRLRPIQIQNARITFDPRLPIRFRDQRQSLDRRIQQALFTDVPKNYCPVRVHLSARSTFEAAERAQYILDLMRAILNWFYNRGQPTRMSFGSQEPVNRIAIGPIHTLHLPNGALATDTFWFEDAYRAPIKLLNIDKHWQNLIDSYRLVQRKLRYIKYRVILEGSLVRYVRALDDRDWHSAFLKLWGVLEILTATEKERGYKPTIDRASYVFSDHQFQKQSLKVLRKNRNRIVHASASSREIETYMYQLKFIIESLIEFHLFANYRFNSIQHACEFLSLPISEEALESRVKMGEYALHYRGYRKHTDSSNTYNDAA